MRLNRDLNVEEKNSVKGVFEPPAPKLACFVFYLKIINIVFEN